MTYIIQERDFHYIPEPEDDTKYDFDPVIWTKEIIKEVHTVNEFLEACTAFSDAFTDVTVCEYFEDTIIGLVSNANSDHFGHPDYYYTNRHQILVYPKEE